MRLIAMYARKMHTMTTQHQIGSANAQYLSGIGSATKSDERDDGDEEEGEEEENEKKVRLIGDDNDDHCCSCCDGGGCWWCGSLDGVRRVQWAGIATQARYAPYRTNVAT